MEDGECPSDHTETADPNEPARGPGFAASVRLFLTSGYTWSGIVSHMHTYSVQVCHVLVLESPSDTPWWQTCHI
jgi:hypothetical protein